MNTTTKRWTLLHSPKRSGDGHKIFRDWRGRIALADWSGSTPDRTDDGVLYVAPVIACRVGLRSGHGILIHIPLTDYDGKECGTYGSIETLRALKEAGVNVTLKLESVISDLVEFVNTTPKEQTQ